MDKIYNIEKRVLFVKYIKFQLEKMYVKFVLYIIVFVGLSFIGYHVDINIQSSGFAQIFSFTKNFTETLAFMAVEAVITIITITFSAILVVMMLLLKLLKLLEKYLKMILYSV
jgi:hypothetical protein